MISKPKTFFLIAGETSGDLLGSRLIHGIQEERPAGVPLPNITGIGGPEMERAGNFQSFFPMNELSHMGLLEILPHIPHLLKRIRQTKDHILSLQPDVLITIDAPEFSLRVAKQVAKACMKRGLPKIPLIHCVAPSVWAWRPKRAKKIAGFLDHLLALFPFEPPYFKKEGLDCTFVGHPILEQPKGSKERFYQTYPLDPTSPLLCVLPGSRPGEVTRLLPIFTDAVSKIRAKIPNLGIIIPTVPSVEGLVRERLSLFPTDAPHPLLISSQDRFDAFAAATVALAASGTVTLELAFQNTPMIVAYQASWLTEKILRQLVQVPYVCLVNIILNKRLIPELLQKECCPENLAREILTLLTSPKAMDLQKQGLNDAIQALQAPQPFRQMSGHAVWDQI